MLQLLRMAMFGTTNQRAQHINDSKCWIVYHVRINTDSVHFQMRTSQKPYKRQHFIGTACHLPFVGLKAFEIYACEYILDRHKAS